MVTIVETEMYHVSQLVFLPLVLLLSFGLCQYITLTYYNRRREQRGILLLETAFLGFACLVPLTHPKEKITIIERESSRKVKVKSVHHVTVATEMLIVVELVVILLDLVEVFQSSVAKTMSKEMSQTIEDAPLMFIVVFRYYYLGLIKGFKNLLKIKKKGLLVYFLFLTHEYPFVTLVASSNVSWKFVQGVYHCLLVFWCIWSTVKDKIKHGGIGSLMTTARSQHASQRVSQASVRHGPRRRTSDSVVPDLKVTMLRESSVLFTSAAIAPAKSSGPQLQRLSCTKL